MSEVATLAPFAEYAAARLVRDPEQTCSAWAVRGDYFVWSLGLGLRPQDMGKQRAVIKAMGGVVTGTKIRGKMVTNYSGVGISQETPDGLVLTKLAPAYQSEPASDSEVNEALTALYYAGLVRDTKALDVAWLRLSLRSSGSLCRACGTVTRHGDQYHVACTSKSRDSG